MRFALVAIGAALICAPAYAAGGASSAPTIVDQERKIDQLTRQIQDMQRQQTDLINQLKEVKEQIKVPVPAASPSAEAAAVAAATPAATKTIGDYIAELEQTRVPVQPAHPIPPASWPVVGIY